MGVECPRWDDKGRACDSALKSVALGERGQPAAGVLKEGWGREGGLPHGGGAIRMAWTRGGTPHLASWWVEGRVSGLRLYPPGLDVTSLTLAAHGFECCLLSLEELFILPWKYIFSPWYQETPATPDTTHCFLAARSLGRNEDSDS